jgi:hypothetical protein
MIQFSYHDGIYGCSMLHLQRCHNMHNTRMWVAQDVHNVRAELHPQQFSLVGINGDHLISTHILPAWMNCNYCLLFLQQ